MKEAKTRIKNISCDGYIDNKIYQEIYMKRKLIKTYKNIGKNSKIDIRSNNKYFEGFLLNKLIFV